jgi:hypothetical protein
MGFPPWRAAAVAAAVLAAVAGSTLTATAAGASTTPGVASQSRIAQHQGLRPQFFTIVFTPASPDGVVTAVGPVHGRGTDKQASNTLDVLTFKHGSVNVHHTDVSNAAPKINRKACTATVSVSGNWLFQGGTGKYSHAFGSGHFKFFEIAKLARDKNGKCDTDPNHPPVSFFGKVIASGKATVGKQ